MEQLTIVNDTKVLEVQQSRIDGSVFKMVRLGNTTFNDVYMANCKITNADLSNLEIEGAQLGGAYIHNVGFPPEGHPAYKEKENQKPLRFDDCNLSGSTINNCNLTGVEITDCNLTGVEITDCNINGLKINGILVKELLRKYNAGD